MTELALHLCNPDSLANQSSLLKSGNLMDMQWPRNTIPLERGAWETIMAELPAENPPFATRLYLGNEFCPYLAWSLDELQRGKEVAQAAGFGLTVVFCPQWERSLDHTLTIVDSIQEAFPNLEVVANDWGLLAALKDRPVKAVVGRLLYKAKRNPRLSRETLPAGLPESADQSDAVLHRQLAQWSLLPSDAPWLATWLEEMAATRVEMELVPQGLKCDADNPVPLSLHIPWTYITGGGHCPVAVLSNEGEVTRCNRGCRTTIVESTYPTRTWPLRQVGHTVFSPMVSLLKGYMEQPRIDRWVLSPGLPM